MKRALGALALLASSLTPAFVEAKAVEEVTFGSDAADVIVTVLSDQVLHAPTVRTYSGLVRVRFYDADELPTLRFEGDGSAIKHVELARGSDKSAALNIGLGDQTKLALSDVRVEREGEKTLIRIARGLLPALGKPSPAAPVKAVEKPKANAQAAAPAAAPTPVAKAAAQEPAAEAAPQAKPKPLFAAEPADAAQKPGLKLGNEQSSTMPLLIAISALLAVAYGALRLFLSKNKLGADAIPAIDVVAQKRLGPRHQLVIVRAFDRDYLLSIQGSQTTVVARSTRRDIEAADAAEAMLSPIGKRSGAVSPASGLVPAAARDFEDDEPTFGGELFKQALEQRERAREQTAGFRLESARAQARAELARMDEGPSEKLEDEPNLGSVEPEGGISDAVSGLLRLRRKTGR